MIGRPHRLDDGSGVRAGRRAGRARRRTVPGALLPVMALVLASCSSGDDGPDFDRDGPIFSGDSVWNQPIEADPVLDPQSPDMVSALLEDGGGIAQLYDYGIPVYEVDEDTPRVDVSCTETEWGPCPLEQEPLRIPDDAVPSAGSDGAMVVIDWSTGRVYDFWRAERLPSGDWTASWGTWASVDGDGVGGADGGSTGAGLNLLGGLIRLDEIEAGEIDHALALVSDKSCPEVYRYPAIKTDGHSSGLPCIPQGARVQLDPAIDVESIPGITPGEIAVAQALQSHGGYLRDSSKVAMGIAFEVPTGDRDPYPDVAGFPYDYYEMPHIPWSQLRVLASWDGR